MTTLVEQKSVQAHSVKTGVWRGLKRTCPNCGEGRLFRGFLALRKPCEVCGTDNTIYPSDDMPPYLTILIVGHIVVPLFMWSDRAFEPAIWVQTAIWLPVTLVLSLLLLPVAKGAVIGFCWAMNLTRQNSST
jgi:uncharacterized protein (DUF983 family)